MEWMSTEEALQSLAFKNEDELEDFVLEFDLEARVDDSGRITAIQAWDLREPLFTLHERRAGFRPDDPDAMVAATKEHEARQQDEVGYHRSRRHRLRTRVARRAVRRNS